MNPCDMTQIRRKSIERSNGNLWKGNKSLKGKEMKLQIVWKRLTIRISALFIGYLLGSKACTIIQGPSFYYSIW
jgi:hypothetical protein